MQDSCGDEPHNQMYRSVTAINNGIVQAKPSSTFKSKSYNTREIWSRVQENERNYSTDKKNEKHGCEARTLDRQIDVDEYYILDKAESLLFEKVILKNRIDSGSVTVCEVVAFSASSFIF